MIDSLRFYSAEEVHSALRYEALADSIAAALRTEIVAPLRHAHAVSATDSLLLMPAWNEGVIGIKLVSVQPGNSLQGRATVNALYVLFDRHTGEPRAVIDGEALTLRRTAAASLLAARYLARADASIVLIIGTGPLALHLAHAHCSELAVDRLLIWGRTPQHARSLAAKLTDQLRPAEVVADLEAAVAAAHIVSCATTATSPIVRGAWLRPGTHVDLVGAFKRGMREADDEAAARSSVYVDTFDGVLAEADDVIQPIERGVIARHGIRGDLAGLVRNTASGRTSEQQVTLFKSVGTAIEDLAAAQMLLATSPT